MIQDFSPISELNTIEVNIQNDVQKYQSKVFFKRGGKSRSNQFLFKILLDWGYRSIIRSLSRVFNSVDSIFLYSRVLASHKCYSDCAVYFQKMNRVLFCSSKSMKRLVSLMRFIWWWIIRKMYTAQEKRTDSLFHQVGGRADIDDLVLVGHRAETFLPCLKDNKVEMRYFFE